MQKMRKAIRLGLLYGVTFMLSGAYALPALAAPVLAEAAPASHQQTSLKDWRNNKEARQASKATKPPAVTPSPTQELPATPAQETPETKDAPLAPETETATITDKQQASSTTEVEQKAIIENNQTASSTTGNAGIIDNTTAGSATTGDAAAETTLLNVVHSTVQGGTAGVAHFTTDIYGNVVGDITLAPSIGKALSESQPTDSTSSTIVDTATKIENNIGLDATSGDAKVVGNTTAGSAQTGTATTVANIVNLINSIIAANQSFIGTINIYGNLDGDILLSPSFTAQLLADNSKKSTAPDLLSLNSADNQSIINNISLGAQTGTATLKDNTTAGDAITGKAATNLTVLNLSGHQVTASNSLLVFVNVLGTWIGVIVDAPAGTTAAMLGNGVTANQVLPVQTTASTNESSIVNNLTLNSTSGNAKVADNTTAGNATTGDASASANIANISTSSFSLSDWFGVLFINVFGTWSGSFGINTLSGEVIPLSSPLGTPSSMPMSQPFQFGFVPGGLSQAAASRTQPIGSNAGTATELTPQQHTAVLAAMTSAVGDGGVQQPAAQSQEAYVDPIAIATMVIGFTIAIGGLGLKFIRR